MFRYEVACSITKELKSNEWRLTLQDLLEEVGLPRTTRGFRLVTGPTWIDRDSNRSHGSDYYEVKVEGPADKIDVLERFFNAE